MKTIIISDLHGCCLEFRALLRTVGFNRSEDKLILLGDLFDRGKHSYEVFQFVKQLRQDMGERLILIRGNHDQMLLDHLEKGNNMSLWAYNGGLRTIRSFSLHGEPLTSAGELLKDSVLFYETEQFIAVHAGLISEHPEENSEDVLLWDRTVIEGKYTGKLGIGGHTPLTGPVWFMPDGNYLVLSYGMEISLPDRGFICLDTGCVFGKKLTAMIISEDVFRLYSVSHKDYS